MTDKNRKVLVLFNNDRPLTDQQLESIAGFLRAIADNLTTTDDGRIISAAYELCIEDNEGTNG